MQIPYHYYHSKNSALPPPTIFTLALLAVALALGVPLALGVALAVALGVALGVALALELGFATGQSFADALHFDSFNESFKMDAISDLILLSSFIISV
jgi:hydrogenase/urease accessory protein HupE